MTERPTAMHPLTRKATVGYGCVGALAAMLAVALLSPLYSNYVAVTQTSEVLASIGAVKAAIEERAAASGTLAGSGRDPQLAQSLEGDRSTGVEASMLLDDGVIVMQLRGQGQVLILVPSIEAGRVRWRCLGGSRAAVPPDCRSL